MHNFSIMAIPIERLPVAETLESANPSENMQPYLQSAEHTNGDIPGISSYEGDILPTILASGRILVDHLRGEMFVDGTQVNLTTTELKVLEKLIINRDRSVDSQEMVDSIWGGYADPKAANVYIGYIRRKMGSELGAIIRTRRNFGFKIVDDLKST